MSTRAIAPVVGIAFRTVARDLETTRVSSDTPAVIKDAQGERLYARLRLLGPNTDAGTNLRVKTCPERSGDVRRIKKRSPWL